MAAKGAKTAPIGSSQWIQNENDNTENLIADDLEEFTYSARNEFEWLNQHMADIFSNTQVTFADMFKTPGKLRGKTPRTARKVNTLAPRQPLTDIFAPNKQPAALSPAKNTAFYEKVTQLQVPVHDENQVPLPKPVSRGTSPQRAGKPYTDSGYHGMMTEDEMDTDAQTQLESIATSSQAGDYPPQKVPVRDDQAPPQRLRDSRAQDAVVSDDSFVSAKEQGSGPENDIDEIDFAAGDTQPFTQEDEEVPDVEMLQDENVVPLEEVEAMEVEETAKPQQTEVENDVEMDVEVEAEAGESDTSSPEKPLNRKSSFTFSSLPAREPLGSKRSIGATDAHRSSVFNKSIGAKVADTPAAEEKAQQKSTDIRGPSKTSAQSLHDRINLLGKTKEPRSSKSIPQSTLVGQAAYPQLPNTEQAQSLHPTKTFEFPVKNGPEVATPIDDEEDDWIAPTKPAQSVHEKATGTATESTTATLASPRAAMHQKSASTMDVASPPMAHQLAHKKATSVSQPNLAEVLQSTTPIGSPTRKADNAGLSASKSRLWSALKSAKSIFASSASASAAAKLEAHNDSPNLTRSPTREGQENHKIFNLPGALWSQKEVLQSPVRNNSVISFSPSRKTRHSNESDKKREKELKAQEKAAADLEKAREKERQKAAKQQAEEKARVEKAAQAEAAKLEKERQQTAKLAAQDRPVSATSEKASENDNTAANTKSSMLPAGKLRAPGRLMRPTKEPATARPAPVSVRMPSQAQRPGQSSAAPTSFSKSTHENLASSTASFGGQRPGSAQGHRPGTAGGNARVKALEAAARKKEADEKAAAKKAEQKRELERKRAEKAEQEKRDQAERKAAEQQRIQEAKQAVERKAAEKRAAEARKREQERAEQQKREQERLEQQRQQERLEQQRREAERQRQEEDARKAKEAHDLAEAIRRERAQQQVPRGDLPGTLRQLTKNTVPAANPAKPAKRQFPMDDEEQSLQPQRPGIFRNAPSYQQADAKRRRTNEEYEGQPKQRSSVMAPPKRPSTMRKETMSKFSGYTHAPPPAAHHASMFKQTVTAQHQMQHGSKQMHPSHLVQTSNARIPFADNGHPPAPHQLSQQSSAYDANKFKTPARPTQQPKSAKSTPHYQGDNIELPDIASDSEDEDDDDEPGGFRAPSWTASPALRELLTQQQLVDPEAVFGPIGELDMEKVFKNGKNQDRLKRFRDRGSSAMWVETGDAVTSAEKRKDMELRERVVREGGWRYEPGL